MLVGSGSGAEDGSINVWSLHTGTVLSCAGPSSSSSSRRTDDPATGAEVTGLAMCSSTGAHGQASACIVATGWDRKVTLYDAGVPGQRRCPQLRAAAGPTSDVLAAAVMPNTDILATACYNGEVRHCLDALQNSCCMRPLCA